MAIDLKKSFSSVVLEKPIATGSTISTEGVVLVRVVEGGVEKVAATAGALGETVVGWSMANNEQPATDQVIETLSAPVISAGTGTMQLSHTSLVFSATGTPGTLAEIRIYDALKVGGAGDLVQVDTLIGVNANNKFFVDPATGIVTLFAGQSTHSLVCYYRYNMTVVQSQQKFFQPNVNNTSINILGLVGVYTGKGQIFTLQYDASVDYSSLPALYTHGPSGGVTSSAGGTLLTGARVIKAPTAADLSLGIEFNF